MGILDKFNQLIVEHGSAVVRGDHIELLREQLRLVDKRVAELELENSDLKAKLAGAERKTMTEEFVEYRGALFKRNATGGYHLTVYCPNCRRVAGTIDEHFPYSCAGCRWAVEFTPHDLPDIIKKLPA